MPNSRKHLRVPCHLRCWCESDNVTVYARLGNLSEGGLFLRTSTPLEQGTVTRVHFGEGHGVRAEARVRWARVEGQGGPPGMGLSFEAIDDASKVAIRRLVNTEQTD